jgi:DNA-binding MarR family transcriptional regulator
MKETLPSETVGQLMREVKDVFHKLTRQLNLFFLRWNVPFTTYMVLDYLDCHHDHAESAGMADELTIPRQTMTALLDALEKQDILTRLPHPQDRRRKIVKLTPHGQEKVKRLKREIHAIERQTLAQVGEKEMRTLIRTMCKHVDALQQTTQDYRGPATPF